MTLPAPTRSPLAIIAAASSRGTHLTSAVSSVRAAGHVQVLGEVGVAGHRLVGQHEPHVAGAPPGFFLGLPHGRGGAVFTLIHVPAGHLPDPFAEDEPVPPHQQDV